VEDDAGPYPAMALDVDKRPVDAVGSNMGHLLMTGILEPAEAERVAGRLTDPSMSSGWGLRTMASTARGYNPLSYHGGSVWPHDTAIAVWGLVAAGLGTEANGLIRGLVRAAPHFDYRLPELFGGMRRVPGGHPVQYPTACSPQAWAAASGLLLVRSCLGLDVDVPRRRIAVRPPWPPVYRRFELRDLPVAGGSLDLVVDADAGVEADLRDADFEVVIEGP
jgi:glycogen debranching enzyme